MSDKNNNQDLPTQVDTRYEYRILEEESTALSSVFNKLFELVENDLN